MSEYEKLVVKYDSDLRCKNHDFSMARARIAKLKAEMAALRARRCDECVMWKWRSCPVSFFGLFEYHDLADDERGTGGGYDHPAPDFACNRWAGRQ